MKCENKWERSFTLFLEALGCRGREQNGRMMEEGVYGGGKAGAPFDPLTFVQRPQVILRAVTWVRNDQSTVMPHYFWFWWMLTCQCDAWTKNSVLIFGSGEASSG